MTANDQQNLERKLNHVLDMGKHIIDHYPHITCTERAGLLLAMMAAVRQTATNMQTVAALLRKNLLDTFRIDYKDYARRVENLLKFWGEELSGAPMIYNLDTFEYPLTKPHEIVLKEDLQFDLAIRNAPSKDFGLQESRAGLIDNATELWMAVDNGLEQLARTLRKIDEDYHKLKRDSQLQEECLKALEEKYEEGMWEEDKDRLKEKVRMYEKERKSKDKDTYQLFLHRMEWEATDHHDIKVLAELNECFLAGRSTAAFIVENRSRLTMEDLARHFCFVNCRQLLMLKIESFDLLQPADSDYCDLFVNRAAQELAFLLARTLGFYVDFKHHYQYAALLMAMQDLGLAFRNRNNGVQMQQYVNRAFLKEGERMKDQTSLTQWTGKLLGGCFCKMDENRTVGNYTTRDFLKLKNHYWLCLSIINKVLQKKLQAPCFAAYLLQEHPNTPSIADYKNSNGESAMDRLYVLKSVIRGETPLE